MNPSHARSSMPCPLAAAPLLLSLLAATPAWAGPAGDAVVVPDESPALMEFRKRAGIELSYYHQEQPYQLSGIPAISLPAGIGLDNVAISGIENEISHGQVKFDYDVLPFWNLFAALGWVDGETSLTATGNLALPGPAPAIPAALPLQIDYEGLVYGIGTTLAYGGEHWFASLTGFYSQTDLDVGDSQIDAWVVMPRVGYRWRGLSLWIGAMYLDTEEDHRGTYNVNLGPPFGVIPIGYAVSLQQKENVNLLVGLNYQFSEQWNATLEGGFGDRESLHVALQWRF